MPRNDAINVRMPGSTASHASEALMHVAREVFDADPVSDDPADVETRRKSDALKAAARICAAGAGRDEVELVFTKEQAELMPEALRHVAREVFDDEGEIPKALRAVADQISPEARLGMRR